MGQGKDYIATWFYRETGAETSYYPQAGGRGDSALLHSVYMQIQVPFYLTFRYHNPDATLLFFTNMDAAQLPAFLADLFRRTDTKVITLPYENRPPVGWYKAWMNQFYVYDVMRAMQTRLQHGDTLLICDADCLCLSPLDGLFYAVREQGSVLYDMQYPRDYSINGTTLEQMEEVYSNCYGEAPSSPLSYYGGEFIGLRGDMVTELIHEMPTLWQYNFSLAPQSARLHEEAHFLSLLAERMRMRNDLANAFVKRMWTGRAYRNVESGDENLPVWHLPAEKKFGLHRLYRKMKHGTVHPSDVDFRAKAGQWCGVPEVSWTKRMRDYMTEVKDKIRS